jgi:hypothetical protein
MGGGGGRGWHNNLISKLLACQFGEKRYEIRKKCQPLFDYDFEKKKKEKRIWGKSNYHPHAIQTNKQTNKCHKPKEFLPPRGKGDHFRSFNSVEETRSNRVRKEVK